MSPLITLNGRQPQIDPTAFVAENATIIGAVTVGREASIWFGAVLRGDSNTIRIGARSNIQDLSVLHVDAGHTLTIGEEVTIGHRAIIHGCSVGDRTLVGMGAILMNGVELGADCLVAAGSVVTEGTIVPPRSLLLGVPAKVKRPLTDNEVAGLLANAKHYVKQSRVYWQLGKKE